MSRHLVRTSLVASFWIVGLTGCSAFVGAERSSPTQTAVGLKANVPLVGAEAGTLLAVGGVQRQWFDGGHDNVLTAGLLGRRTVTENGAWIGAEGTYNNWRVSDGFEDPVANVFGLSGLAGYPIRRGVSLWGSAGVLSFSDFEKDGALVYEGGTGWQFNAGVELAATLLTGN